MISARVEHSYMPSFDLLAFPSANLCCQKPHVNPYLMKRNRPGRLTCRLQVVVSADKVVLGGVIRGIRARGEADVLRNDLEGMRIGEWTGEELNRRRSGHGRAGGRRAGG